MKKKDLNKLEEALFSRAIGFSKDEVSEEYNIVEDKLTLTKKKLNSKYYPPELKAIEMLMEKYNIYNDQQYDSYTFEQLNEEKEKLIKLLKDAEEKKVKNDRKAKEEK